MRREVDDAIISEPAAIGVSISKRQLVRLLSQGQEAFLDVMAEPCCAWTREVLRTGLEAAPWITVDDTGARHKASRRSAPPARRGEARLRHDVAKHASGMTWRSTPPA